MLRDIDADYAHEIHYDENLNLLSPDIKILKKEYLDAKQNIQRHSPIQGRMCLSGKDWY